MPHQDHELGTVIDAQRLPLDDLGRQHAQIHEPVGELGQGHDHGVHRVEGVEIRIEDQVRLVAHAADEVADLGGELGMARRQLVGSERPGVREEGAPGVDRVGEVRRIDRHVRELRAVVRDASERLHGLLVCAGRSRTGAGYAGDLVQARRGAPLQRPLRRRQVAQKTISRDLLAREIDGDVLLRDQAVEQEGQRQREDRADERELVADGQSALERHGGRIGVSRNRCHRRRRTLRRRARCHHREKWLTTRKNCDRWGRPARGREQRYFKGLWGQPAQGASSGVPPESEGSVRLSEIPRPPDGLGASTPSTRPSSPRVSSRRRRSSGASRPRKSS